MISHNTFFPFGIDHEETVELWLLAPACGLLLASKLCLTHFYHFLSCAASGRGRAPLKFYIQRLTWHFSRSPCFVWDVEKYVGRISASPLSEEVKCIACKGKFVFSFVTAAMKRSTASILLNSMMKHFPHSQFPREPSLRTYFRWTHVRNYTFLGCLILLLPAHTIFTRIFAVYKNVNSLRGTGLLLPLYSRQSLIH